MQHLKKICVISIFFDVPIKFVLHISLFKFWNIFLWTIINYLWNFIWNHKHFSVILIRNSQKICMPLTKDMCINIFSTFLQYFYYLNFFNISKNRNSSIYKILFKIRLRKIILRFSVFMYITLYQEKIRVISIFSNVFIKFVLRISLFKFWNVFLLTKLNDL